jgi:hypothetical protein
MSYGPNFATGFLEAASLLDRGLRGANPGGLPTVQPSELRQQGVTPHVAQNTGGRRSAIDARSLAG